MYFQHKIFLKKWGISIRFFKKHYLRSDTKFEGSLKEPNKNINYYLDLLKVKASIHLDETLQE